MESLLQHKTGVNNLIKRWDELKNKHPKLRTKDAADRLGVSEAELIASKSDGKNIIRLKEDWEGIFKRLEVLGSLMALTRNDAAVHEKTGIYQNVSFEGHAGLVLDEQIDLRIFYKRWGFGFALPVENPKGILHSFQFFDKEGVAVHKIYLKDKTKLNLYNDIVESFKSENQSTEIVIDKSIQKDSTQKREDIDIKAFLDAWSELKDTHDFFPMLRKFKADRTDALELARGHFSWKVDNSTVNRLLAMAAEREVPIMVFVGNKGMIQIHSGPINKIREIKNWLNILDQDFNLHLRQDLIYSSWIVEKPTVDGLVTSLELFSDTGEQIATFFGARKPGKPELIEWKKITAELKNRSTDK